MAAAPHTHAASPRPAGPGPRFAGTALGLGILGLAAGFTGVALLGAVAAITMGSLGRQAIAAGRMERALCGRLDAAIACGVVALGVWLSAIGAAGLARA